jgi:hypothetical protein
MTDHHLAGEGHGVPVEGSVGRGIREGEEPPGKEEDAQHIGREQRAAIPAPRVASQRSIMNRT